MRNSTNRQIEIIPSEICTMTLELGVDNFKKGGVGGKVMESHG